MYRGYATEGCRTTSRAAVEFFDTARFRDFPYVPTPETAV